MRNRSGVSQSWPSVSRRTTRYWIAILAVRDPAGGLHADLLARRVIEIADRFEHDQRHRQRRGGLDFAGAGLDEIRAGVHREVARFADVVERAEFAGFEDHFQMRRAAGGFDRGDFVEDIVVIARPGNARAR